MRMKIPFLAGVIALAVAGHAMAGQEKAIFISFANPTSSSGKAVSARLSKTAATGRVAQTRNSKNYSVPASSNPVQIPGETSARYPRDEYPYLPAANLPMAGGNSDNENQTFGGSSDARNHSFLGGSFSDEFAGGQGGHANEDMSDTFTRLFENADDFSNHNDDKTHYFNCSVTAVPEPDEWLLMLFGLGLVGLIATFRKQEVADA